MGTSAKELLVWFSMIFVGLIETGPKNLLMASYGEPGLCPRHFCLSLMRNTLVFNDRTFPEIITPDIAVIQVVALRILLWR